MSVSQFWPAKPIRCHGYEFWQPAEGRSIRRTVLLLFIKYDAHTSFCLTLYCLQAKHIVRRADSDHVLRALSVDHVDLLHLIDAEVRRSMYRMDWPIHGSVSETMQAMKGMFIGYASTTSAQQGGRQSKAAYANTGVYSAIKERVSDVKLRTLCHQLEIGTGT